MKITLLLLLVTGAAAYGQNKPVSEPGQTETQTLEQRQSQKTTSKADGGDANLNIRYPRDRRQAPSIGVAVSPSTAEMMVCYGIGGTNSTGAATGLWCVLQKDLYAEHISAKLEKWGLYEASAAAYCSRKLHWKHFGSVDKCKKSVNTAITPSPTEYNTVSETETQMLQAAQYNAKRKIEALEQRVAAAEKAVEQAKKPKTSAFVKKRVDVAAQRRAKSREYLEQLK